MNMTSCKDCGYYAHTHYDGTPKNEWYHECEYHYEVLDSLKPCKHFIRPEDMEDE